MQCLSSDSETAQGNKCSLAGKTSYVFRVCSVNVIELALIHCYNTYTHTHTHIVVLVVVISTVLLYWYCNTNTSNSDSVALPVPVRKWLVEYYCWFFKRWGVWCVGATGWGPVGVELWVGNNMRSVLLFFSLFCCILLIPWIWSMYSMFLVNIYIWC